jgi:hypothetical protein
LLTLCSANVAHADMSYEDFDRHRDSPVYRAFFDGLFQGISWANAVVWTNGAADRVLIYCAPGAVTREQAIDVIDRSVATHPDRATWFVSAVLATGLAETFPCPR